MSKSIIHEHFRKLDYTKHFNVWISRDLTEKNSMGPISICDTTFEASSDGGEKRLLYSNVEWSWEIRISHPKSRTSRVEDLVLCLCQVIYSQFGLAIHQNDHQARRRFVEWSQNEIAVVPDFHKRILFSDEAHFWLNGYVNKQNCRIWSEANPQVYVETPLHPEKLTVWCALWAGGIILQKR
ncbi:hypothetical protein TNCV_4940401 [Trichonephila clavipes]|nr:hypothetical protein TNCV_4940401 [Trichonephila clavipes]